jgi:hypothetical protein
MIFVLDKWQRKKTTTETEVGNCKDLTSHVIYALSPNVHSLNNKLTESAVACCREHCQKRRANKTAKY